MVRVLSFVLFLAACSHPPPNVAVTIAQPVEELPKVAPDQTDQRIKAAKEDIAAQHFGAASRALLAIVCGERNIHGQEDLARCPASPFVNTAEAWGLLGDLALKGRLELSQTEWSAAQRVVTRWGNERRDGAQLELAEIALSHATRQSASPKYALALATTREKLHRCGAALDAFAKVLESSSYAHRKEALDGAASCLTNFDWDNSGENDDVIGFDRPEVRTMLGASQQSWVAELYARVIESFIDERECDAARAGASAFTRQFPQNPNASRLAANVQNCP
jgi:hypothetical protein